MACSGTEQAFGDSLEPTEAEGDSAEDKKHHARPYQLELVDYALKQNTIVNLGTGAGKTFVAMMVIKELAYQTHHEFTGDEGQRTIFLAHTVPLVKQQARCIKEQSGLEVGEFYGEMKDIDRWDTQKWWEQYNRNNVLVMSRQIFLDTLNRAMITPRQVNLIVFDECHHATKNDPYVQIMKVVRDCPPEHRPRILGLSASLLGKKVRPGELEKGVKQLEEVLMCRAKTSNDIQEVVKYATNPEERISHFDASSDKATKSLRPILKEAVLFLRTKVIGAEKSSLGEAARNLLDDCLQILEDLGPASAASFVDTALRELRTEIQHVTIAPNYVDEWSYKSGYLALTHLTVFKIKCEQLKRMYGQLQDSSKVKKLLLELGDLAVCSGEMGEQRDSSQTEKTKDFGNRLAGVVFVERRYIAMCLAELIKKKSQSDHDLKHVRCDFIVGHNVGQGGSSIRKGAKMKSKSQDCVLSKFRKGKINLLIATSVIEEGVDVPKCNLVVRFDLPQNFRSYIQSKGRARSKPSLFLLLVESTDTSKLTMIRDFNLLERELIELCQRDRKVPSEERIQARMKDKVPNYMPFGPEGARATGGNSLTIVHKYCQKLPCDMYTVLSPKFSLSKRDRDKACVPDDDSEDEDLDPKHEYKCQLTLPMNCPVKKEIESIWMPTKLWSKRAAARDAVELLHKHGELDHNLQPAPILDSDNEETREEKKIPASGTEKRARLYRKAVAEDLQDCFPQIDSKNYLYVFLIRDSDSGEFYQSGANEHQTVGILARKQLKWWMLPKFALYVKEPNGKEKQLLVTVHEVVFDGCSKYDVEVWSSAHKAIFSKILNIIPSSLTDTNLSVFDKSYLVVPVVVKQIDHTGELVKAIIDVDTVAILDRLMHKVEFMSPDERVLKDHLFTVDHRRNESSMGILELYELVQVDTSITPLSPFPDSNFSSFKEYFKSKYDFELQEESQSGLKCHRFSMLYLKLITSRFVSSSDRSVSTASMEGKDSDIVLFPEVIKLHPLPANLWRLIRCIPSILWRMECFLLGGEIVSLLSLKAWIGRSSSDQSKVWLTDATLHGYRSATTSPPSKMVSLPIELPATVEAGSSCKLPREGLFARGPDAGLILYALTPTGANDSVSLEELEVLGDSLLKLVSSVYLFISRVSDHEGKLSSARQRRVSNFNLYRLARDKQLPEKMLASDFTMGSDASGPQDRIRWIPPGFRLSGASLDEYHSSVPEENRYTLSKEMVSYLYCQISDKCVADMVEGLIGAYTVAGGMEAGIRFMKWLGIKLGGPSSSFDYSNQNYRYPVSSSILTSNSSEIFQEHFGEPEEMKRSKRRLISSGNDYIRMLTQVTPVQKKLKYQFDNHALLIEALTHPSYDRNRHTNCYQNLEFLGDAILDYLITCHVVTHEHFTAPKKISTFRSAVVNNTVFAQLSVDRGFYKHMLHSSPQLFRKIEQFVALRKEEQEPAYAQALPDQTYDDSEFESSDEEYDDDFDDEEARVFDPPKAIADIFESLAAAVFLDAKMDLDMVWKVFEPILRNKIGEARTGAPVSPVQLLYEKEPVIRVRKKRTGKGRWKCTISVLEKGVCESAIADSYKNAKAAASKKVLALLQDTRL